MDINRFLSGGMTHVHTDKPLGPFAKAATVIVASFALGSAAVTGVIFTATYAGLNVSAMPIDSHRSSQFYQGLVAPDSSAEIKIISTQSSNLRSVLDVLPDKFLEGMERSAWDQQGANHHAIDSDHPGGMATSFTKRTFSKHQSLCVVEAERMVDGDTLEAGGREYWSFGQAVQDDPVQKLTNLSPSEAKAIITIHELAHCETNLYLDLGEKVFTQDKAVQQAFDQSVEEMASDLAVVLYYASQEGSFDNGRIAVGSIRNNLTSGSHVTLDMLDLVLTHLDPQQFKGMAPPHVFDQVVDIVGQVHSREGQQLYNAFMKEAYENNYLHALASRDMVTTDHLARPEIGSAVMAHHGADFVIDFKARAHLKIDQIINNGLRNPGLHLSIGDTTLQNLSGLALKLNIALTPDQLYKLSSIDPAFGASSDTARASAGLFERDYYSLMQQQSQQALSAVAGSAPRMR